MKRLGGGTRYEVYLAWDEHLCALVVAKVLRPSHVADARALLQLEREAKIIDQLAHPILLRSFGAVLDGPHPHLLVEHLEGPTLRRLIKRQGGLPLEQLLPLAIHIAAALHYMAREEVVHLDVKPSNIVMAVPPRLIDLSIARPLEQAVKLRDSIGTDAYMAPEQCDPVSSPGMIGPPADVFGLGATLHHAITGERPFPREQGASDSEVLTTRFPQLAHPPMPIERNVPAELIDLVTRMLAHNPDERPPAMEVAEALEPLVPARPRQRRQSPR